MVDFEYRSVPPLTTNNASVDVKKNGEDFGVVLASLNDGVGESTWFEQGVLDPAANFTAVPDFRDEDNEPLPPITKRVDVMRLPLTAETHDRQLEVRFAVPTDLRKAYTVRVYAAQPGETFPAEPILTLPWTTIQSAYPSSREVFDDITPGSAKARQPYVIRKIQRVSLPGEPSLSSQEAFALETVFAGYFRYRVSLVEEGGSKREFSRIEGQASYEPQWAGVLDSLIDVGARVAAGSFYDARLRFATTQVPPNAPEAYYFYGISGLVARTTLPIKELLGITKDAFGKTLEATWEYQCALGTLQGLIDGALGDYELVTSPIDTLEVTFAELGQAWRELKEKASQVQFDGFVQRLWVEIAPGEVNPFQAYSLYQRLRGPIGYAYGYVGGMALWQVASAFALAAATAGVGAVATKVGAAINFTAKGAGLVAAVARVLRFFIKVAHYVGKLGGQALDRLFDIFKALARLSAKGLAAIEARYPRAALTLMDPALELMSRSTQAGANVLEAFSRVAGFPDELGEEAARRLINWMISRADGNPSPAFVEWLGTYSRRTKIVGGLENNKAFKEAVEAAPDIPTGVSDDVFEALIAASDDINKLDGQGADNLVAVFVEKHRNIKRPDPSPDPPISTERFMKALIDGPNGPFKKETINAVIRIHSELDVGAWTDEALTGAARLVQMNGDEGAALLERLVRDVTPDSPERVDVVLAKLRDFSEADAVEAFARLVGDGEAKRMAAIVDNLTYNGIEENLVTAINRLRKPPDGPLIPGIATKPLGPPPPQPQPSSLLDSMVNAANLGTAYEPVATLKLIERGDLALDDVVEMGRRFRGTQADGSPSILEADTFAMATGRRVSIDFKHSASAGDSVIDSDLLARVDRAFRDPEPDFDEWWFAVEGNVTAAKYFEIQGINLELMTLFPERFPTEPIKIIEQLGDF